MFGERRYRESRAKPKQFANVLNRLLRIVVTLARSETHTPTGETMPKPKLSPKGEVIAAHGAAMLAAFQVLVSCLEENEAVQPGQFPIFGSSRLLLLGRALRCLDMDW
jgi:hypothetical protein